MFSYDQISKYLYLDIETVSSYKSLTDLKNEDDRLYKLWKRRESYYRMNYEDCKNETEDHIYSCKAGLEAEFSKIVCVSFGSFTDDMDKKFKSFSGDNEIEILELSHKILNNASLKNWKICGHNIKNFDIPFLGKRMVYNGINPPNNIKIWDKKPWEVPFIDTSEVFSFGSWVQQKYLSLDLLSNSLNIDSPKEKMDGSKVGHYFWDLRDYESIKEYCELDVKSVMEIMSKLCFNR